MSLPLDPKAGDRSMVVCGHARFTMLTDRMVRMEWSGDGVFEDRPTLAVVNRRLPTPSFSVSGGNRQCIIATDQLVLRYRDDGRPLHRGNLSVSMQGGVRWHPGQTDDRNLGGTIRTLDGTEGGHRVNWKTHRKTPIRLPHGLLSRSGWAVHDDSKSVVLGLLPDGREWVQARPEGKRQDLYFLGYGHDFKSCLAHAAQVFGRQPLAPRFTLGYWWSRYWAYTEREMRQIVTDFERMGVPLDVLVVDMDWHLPGWTGYTWDRRYFPDPRGFLDWLHKRGIRATLNLHPADGVARHEAQFAAMCRAMGKDPSRTKKVGFDIADPRFMDAYFRLLHHPHEKLGVDFWWMDWQQGSVSQLPGLDPLPWLNRQHWDDMARRGARRPLIFSRFGGLGSGRYPIGFSGDTWGTWDCLAWQVPFTATAANVLCGHWSHDIGGHFAPVRDPQLYLRWVQFGAHSPILRTHTTKDPREDRRFQEYPSPYNRLLIEAVRRRYELVPYIYSENRANVERGLCLCRPMYHEWPSEEDSYRCPHQYLFGGRMIVAPVVARADAQTGLARAGTWLPPGDWYDCVAGQLVSGGLTVSRHYLLSEVPVFVRAGSVVPGQVDCRRLSAACYRDLLVTAYPGGHGEYELYEDDGVSQSYLDNGCARTRLRQKVVGKSRVVEVGPSRGSYKRFERRRSLEVRLPGVAPPVSVTVNGRSVPWKREAAGTCWTYDGDGVTVVVKVASFDITRGARIKVTFATAAPQRAAAGLAGVLRMLDQVRELATAGNHWRVLHKDERLPAELGQSGAYVSLDPACFAATCANVRRKARHLPAVFKAMVRAHDDKVKAAFLVKAAALSKVLLDERL